MLANRMKVFSERDDVVGRVYISEGMELHNQYQGAFITTCSITSAYTWTMPAID